MNFIVSSKLTLQSVKIGFLFRFLPVKALGLMGKTLYHSFMQILPQGVKASDKSRDHLRQVSSRVIALLSVLFLLAPAASADPVISNFSLLTPGCYLYTDKLGYKSANELLSASPLPDAFLGKSAKKVGCTEIHHFEISSVFTSKIRSSLRLDSIPLKSRCIIGNIKLLNQGHAQHQHQTYFLVYRQTVLRKDRAICGVTAPRFAHPKNSAYKIYEPFTEPHLNIKS